MAKRCREYDEFSRQLKKRITEKDVDRNSEGKLKTLYEKTMEKLFAKVRSTSYTMDENQNREKLMVAVQKTCSKCHSMSSAACWNCTLYLCPECRHLCVKCSEYFCADCIAMSESGQEKPVCTACK